MAEAVKDGREPARDSTNGWSAVTTARVDVHTVPGTHNEMFREPYVQTVASTLQSCLDERGKVLAHQLSTTPFTGEVGRNYSL